MSKLLWQRLKKSGLTTNESIMMRAFRALGVQVALEMKGIGKVAL